MDTDAKFAALFAGRTDAVGTDSGGCYRLDRNTNWAELYNTHLHETSGAMGVYPVMGDNTVWWGCVDIDTGTKPGALYEAWEDAWQHSLLLRRVLAHMSIEAWIERTRSDGAHVWVFACEPVPAKTMRHALLAAHQIAGLAQKEVNPKQEELKPGSVGNYVRLPYPCQTRPSLSQHIIEPSTLIPKALSLQEFVDRALETRMPKKTYEQAAELYRPEPRNTPHVASKPFEPVKAPTAYVQALIVNGPVGQDRSSYLWRLARMLKEVDLPFAEAWDLIQEADRRHGKFANKNDLKQLYWLLEKAYQ